MVSQEEFFVVKLREFRVIFPETDTVFCETDMVGVPGGGNGGWEGAGSETLSEDSPGSEDNPPATCVDGISR